MSMLAEPRNKLKYSINPRGLDWVNDESKFGQKLMEKMGWKKGQGLGAQKTGNTDHIHVSVKIDKRGVGCSKKAAEEWLDHQDGFSDILDQLNAEHFDSSSVSVNHVPVRDKEHKLLSLEDKSKNSSRRVHYQKFTKSKDLSLRNSEELACIFGKKTRNKKGKEAVKESNSQDSSDFGVKTSTSSLSSSDYFASKLKQKSDQNSQPIAQNSQSDSNGSFSTNESKESEKSLMNKSEVNRPEQEAEINLNEVSITKKKKKRKHITDDQNGDINHDIVKKSDKNNSKKKKEIN